MKPCPLLQEGQDGCMLAMGSLEGLAERPDAASIALTI